MRYVREVLELSIGGAVGLAVAWYLFDHHPLLLPHRITRELCVAIGAGGGLLLAMMWSGWKVGRLVDRRLPRHLRPVPRFRDGRPFGVLAWRARDLAWEYLWLLLGLLLVLVTIWLAKTFEPGWFR